MYEEGISSKNIHAIMGEHGDSSFVPWNHAYVGCKKITEIIKNNSAEVCKLDEIHQNVVNAAYEIIEKKKATYYGIGMSLSKIVKSVLDNDNSILTVSTFLKDGKYGQDDVYIGVPAVINKNGVKELLELELSKNNKKFAILKIFNSYLSNCKFASFPYYVDFYKKLIIIKYFIRL